MKYIFFILMYFSFDKLHSQSDSINPFPFKVGFSEEKFVEYKYKKKDDDYWGYPFSKYPSCSLSIEEKKNLYNLIVNYVDTAYSFDYFIYDFLDRYRFQYFAFEKDEDLNVIVNVFNVDTKKINQWISQDEKFGYYDNLKNFELLWFNLTNEEVIDYKKGENKIDSRFYGSNVSELKLQTYYDFVFYDSLSNDLLDGVELKVFEVYNDSLNLLEGWNISDNTLKDAKGNLVKGVTINLKYFHDYLFVFSRDGYKDKKVRYFTNNNFNGYYYFRLIRVHLNFGIENSVTEYFISNYNDSESNTYEVNKNVYLKNVQLVVEYFKKRGKF